MVKIRIFTLKIRIPNKIDSKMPTMDSRGPKLNYESAKLTPRGPKLTPRSLHRLIFQQERRKYALSFCQFMKKREKIGYNLNKIEKCTSVIAIILQNYGSKSPHCMPNINEFHP